MTDILWILVLVLATPFAIVYILTLSKWRFSKPVTLTAAALFIAAVTVMNFITIKDMAWMITQYPELDLACRALNIFLETVFAFIFTKQSRAQTVFIVLSMCLCVYIVDAVSITMKLRIGIDLIEFLYKLLLYLFMAFILYRLRKIFREVALYMMNRLWMICAIQMVLVVFSTMLVSFPVPLNLAPENVPLALMMCLINISVYGVLLYLFNVTRRQHVAEKNAVAFHLYASLLERQNNISAQNEKMAGIFRHDLRHIAQMMIACLDSGDISGARELLSDIDKNMGAAWAEPHIRIFTGHKLIDATLSYYMNYAKESGIDATVAVSCMDGVEADKTELAVVLANALENAVNACEALPEDTKRAVRVDGQRRGKQFFLEIANTCAGEVQIDPDTGLPASNREGHGLGSQSIAFFAQKYGASLEYGQTGNWFYLRLLL